jgi:hypothetical protein
VDCSGGVAGAVQPAAEVNSGAVLGWSGVARKRSGSFKAVWGQLGSRRVRKGCSAASRRRRRAAVVGNGAPTGIRRCLEAGEHEQALGKFSRGLMGAMGSRRRLSKAARRSLEGRSGRRRRSGLGMHTARGKEMQMVQV